MLIMSALVSGGLHPTHHFLSRHKDNVLFTNFLIIPFCLSWLSFISLSMYVFHVSVLLTVAQLNETQHLVFFHLLFHLSSSYSIHISNSSFLSYNVLFHHSSERLADDVLERMRAILRIGYHARGQDRTDRNGEKEKVHLWREKGMKRR